ncbi:SDR family oxidoreductase [Nocardia alba]|nr:SDR family oxidoreductase [Nocardia alba]
MAGVVVVVGVGGMGEAIARRQGGGRSVVLADFQETALATLTEQLTGEGYAVSSRHTDVASAESVQQLADHAASVGEVVQVIHTAGLSPVQASVERIVAVNLVGVGYVLDAFGPLLGPGGAGLVISSMAGYMYPPLPADHVAAICSSDTDRLANLEFLQPAILKDAGTAYAVTKQINRIQVQQVAAAWGRRGARVNSISPGVVATAMGHGELAGPTGETMRTMIAMSGSGRVGTSTDIADAAAFLLSSNASFITGIDLLVDGGSVAALHTQTT